MAAFNYMFLPKLYKEYGDGLPTKFYKPGGLEKWGDQIISTLHLMWNISYYSSPVIFTFLYKRGYFVTESLVTVAKFSTGIGILVALSLCMRGLGRSQNRAYVKFAKCLANSKVNKSEEAKKQLRMFDYDFKDFPVDFDVNQGGDESKKRVEPATKASGRKKPFWFSSIPCELAAYLAIHTFGYRMVYPGSIKLIQSYLQPMLLQGRIKLIEEENGRRYKLRSKDNNDVDTLFVDNRENGINGKTLVLCSEGNAGFYEIGNMAIPIELKYSVLGWNHPGFGGSTGKPFPDQDQNSIDAVMQFAITKLGFLPENIILFGWSIGGYSALWLATQYPDIKGVILDATFDDILPLALPKMPQSISGIVKIAIRDYMNLNNNELMAKYKGPIAIVRRTEDEMICTEENNLSTNRGNNLLINTLKQRFPNIFQLEQIAFVTKMLSKPIENSGGTENDQLCFSLLMSYISDNSKTYPLEIGADYDNNQKNQMAEYLIRKHLTDFKSTHCTPLPAEYFHIPWDLLNDTDFVFT